MEREKKNLTQVQEFCETLLQEKLTLEELDAEACLERMEQLEKEGTNFMNIQKTDVHKKKIRGAFLGAGIMLVLMAGMVGMILWGNSVDPLPIGWLLFLIAIPVAFVIAILVALRARLRDQRRSKKMKLLSVEHIPGVEFEALGMVKGTVVYSKNFGKDFMAAMKTLVAARS